MIKKAKFKQIQTFRRQGYSKGAIGLTLKINPRTVAKYFTMEDDDYRDYRRDHTLSSEKGIDWVVSECVRLIRDLTAEQADVASDTRYEYIFPLGRYSYYGDVCPECGAPMVVGNQSYWCSECDYINEMEPV
jgi:hypothetical protein